MKRALLFLLLGGCSYSGYRPDYDALQDRLRKDPAFVESPRGSSAEIEGRLLSLFGPEPAPALAQGAELENLVPVALARNPDLRATLKRLEAAIEAIPQAAGAPDPELDVEAMRDLFENMFEWTVKLMQMLLFPGKLEAQARMAIEMAAEVSERAREQALHTRLMLAEAAARLYEADQALRIVREIRAPLEQLAAAARARYEAGEVPQQDVLRARVRTLQLERQEIELVRRRRETEAGIRSLLGMREAAPVGPISFPAEVADPEPLDPLLNRAFERRPEAAAMTHAMRQALAGLRMAELEWWPDATLMAGTERRPGRGDSAMVGLAIHLSFLRPGKRAAAERQARAVLGEMWHRYEASLNEIAREVSAAHARAVETARSLALFRERLAPEARRTYEAALAGYRAGRVDFEAAVDALVMWQEVRMELERLVADHSMAREALRRSVGEKP
jgi:cobalt-zinc-cadmium efflux system outer membrane protein